MPSNQVNPRQGDDGEQLTVAELLRREGMTQELPVVKDPVDDTPTDRIPVGDLLRREGRWDRRKASKVGALAAGVAALAGIAVTALSTGQLHDTAASTAGGGGGGYVPPEAKSSSQLTTAPSLASSETTAPAGTSSLGRVETRQATGGAARPTTGATGSPSTGGQAQSAPSVPAAPQTTQDASASATPAPTTTTTRSEPPTSDSSTTTAPQGPAARPSPPKGTEQPKGLLGGLLDTIGGLLGG
ncbi:hypothetical protein FG385_21565 [Amycolatopsis alkalitolerans]|uniref:Uncharacterized protein n=1 Tax=Amycolatopsis alkalitolerans TaxID=2547244 RepID=A0A5C4M150_9PSEU|nr:hypothetical protein FG385_21565 [Amycolatopsis alkalitolerans]